MVAGVEGVVAVVGAEVWAGAVVGGAGSRAYMGKLWASETLGSCALLLRGLAPVPRLCDSSSIQILALLWLSNA